MGYHGQRGENLKIPWWEVKSVGTEIEKLSKVVGSNYFNEGEEVLAFENEISKIAESKISIASSSGTTAIFMALKAIGMKQGSRIAIPDLTFIATANSAKLTGAEVVLVDINLENLGISLEDLEREHRINRIDAVVLVHVSGRSAWTNDLYDFCKKEGILVVEDAAEAFGSRDPLTGKILGTIGDLGAYSFSPNKIVTTGQGGVVVTNSEKYEPILRALKDQGRPSRGTGGSDYHPYEGYNFKITNLQAAVGLVQLTQFEFRKNHLIKIYSEYKSRIKNCNHLKLLEFKTEKGEFPLWPDLFALNRASIIDTFKQNYIGFREIWFPIHTQQNYLCDDENFPNSIIASSNILWLPSAFSLDQTMIEKITQSLKCNTCFDE